MKFGDKVKVSDRLWKELTSKINIEILSQDESDGYFIFICSDVNETVIGTIGNMTVLLGGLDEYSHVGTAWEKYTYWRDWEGIKPSSNGKMITFCSWYMAQPKQKDQFIPQNYQDIIPNKTLTYSLPTKEVFSFDDRQKSTQSGGKCLICRDYNPFMNGDGFCWSCDHDPRNQYKIEEMKENLVKMASI